ncbi:hypothetical protein HK103_003782, partial [Boothiomyces macroporosus]
MQKRAVRRWASLLVIATLTYFTFSLLGLKYSSPRCYEIHSDLAIDDNAEKFHKCVDRLLKDYNFQKMDQTRDLLLNYNHLIKEMEKKQVQLSSSSSILLGTIQRLEKSKLLNWFRNDMTISKLARKFVGKGIVISAYDKWFPTAYFAVLHIREYHKSSLPIYIFHNGTELSTKNIDLMKKVRDVTVYDLQDYYDDIKVAYSGYATKAAVILAAPCQECIFLDCDAWFFQNPSVLFEQKGYIDTGLLLFKDRTKDGGTKGMEWVKKLVPKKSLHAIEHLRIYQGKTYHEAESGMVVIDKERRLMNILAIAYLNENTITPQSHKGFH